MIAATSTLLQQRQGGGKQSAETKQSRRVVTQESFAKSKTAKRWQNARAKNPNCLVPAVTALVPRDWKILPKIRPAQEITSDLKGGNQLNANITEIQSKDIGRQLRTLWRSYGCKEPLTLLLTREARETIGATATRIRLTRGSSSVHSSHRRSCTASPRGRSQRDPPSSESETDKSQNC